MKQLLILLISLTVANSIIAQSILPFTANTSIYIVRHAEKQTGKDPLLTADGNARAGDLMRELKNKKIKRIYVTEYKRTQHTADSLHLQLNTDTVHIIADTSCFILLDKID